MRQLLKDTANTNNLIFYKVSSTKLSVTCVHLRAVVSPANVTEEGLTSTFILFFKQRKRSHGLLVEGRIGHRIEQTCVCVQMNDLSGSGREKGQAKFGVRGVHTLRTTLMPSLHLQACSS